MSSSSSIHRLLVENDKEQEALLIQELRVSCQELAENFLQDSMATLLLPETLHCIPARAFDLFRQALPRQDEKNSDTMTMPVLSETSDSANATGYHDYGGLSRRYNQYRRGWVFSNGDFCVTSLDAATVHANQQLFRLLHTILDLMLQALEERLELPTGWFQSQLGPTATNSQWHLKEYDAAASAAATDNNTTNNTEPLHWLGTHTDPSLLSVVIHDRPSVQPNGWGLQHAVRDHKDNTVVWKEIPHSGHGVAVILVGSVLAALSQGKCPACTHRVVATTNDNNIKTEDAPSRVAATLFGRPAPSARLVTPPCWMNDNNQRNKPPLTFAEWNARVARNYAKSKHKQQQKAKANQT